MQFNKIDIKNLFNKLCNPLLFYVDKSGDSFFRNYCLFFKNGYMYSETFSMPEAGKALEYRIQLDKHLRTTGWLIALLVYFILIHTTVNLWTILLGEIVWIALYFGARTICANLYSKFLFTHYGKYVLEEFAPEISKKKQKEYHYSFYSRITKYSILILLFFVPALLIPSIMKIDLNLKKPHFKAAINISKIYSFIYPKTPKIYDMEAYAKYMTEDFEGALKDYKSGLEKRGKHFGKNDYIRFANLLLLEKKLYGSQNAIDTFNEIITKKNLSVMEQSKMLWMKSIFSIQNNVSDFVITDYDELLTSINDKDERNKFYINCDKAYMLYLMGKYKEAIGLYDILIPYAIARKDKYKKELKSLYAERGFAKRRSGDSTGANSDFLSSEIDMYEIDSYEPKFSAQGFMVDKF
jgi:tetratricopeptide (TPR) repeat protein